MAWIQRIFHSEFESYQWAAWEAILTGVVNSNTNKRRKYWKCWIQYISYLNFDPSLQNETDDALVALVTFVARVVTRAYGRGNRIGVQSVSNALDTISKTIEIEGYKSQVYRDHEICIFSIERIIESFHRQDPSPIPQLVFPVMIPEILFEKVF